MGAMGTLRLYEMRAAYDEVLTTAVKRQHEPQQIIGDLLTAEIREKQARSVRYQMTIAKLPLAKELKEFDFENAEVNETLIRDLASGDFLDHQPNLILIGGTGTGKTHPAVSVARACIRTGRRGRFFKLVDLVNKRGAELQGRTADLISRLDLFAIGLERMATRWLTPGRARIFANRPDRRTAAVPPDKQTLRTHLDHRHHQFGLRRMAQRLRRCQDDNRVARPAYAPLRDRRNRKRKLALQEPRIAQTRNPAGPTPLRDSRATQRRACLAQGGQYWAPIRGQHSMPIDSKAPPWRG